MREAKELWTPTVRTWDFGDQGLPNTRRSIAKMGIQNYLDDRRQWNAIDPTLRASQGREAGYSLYTRDTPYEAHFALDGSSKLYLDRFDQRQSIAMPSSRLFFGKTFAPEGNVLAWRSREYDIELKATPAGTKTDIILHEPPPASWNDQIEFDVSQTGMTDAELRALFGGLYVRDAGHPVNIQRPLEVSYSGGVLTLGFDLTGMQYPIRIDPVVKVTGSLEDSSRIATNASATNAHWLFGRLVGGEECTAYARFTGLTGLGSVTVDACVLQIYVYYYNGTPDTNIFFHEVASPTVPTTDAAFDTVLGAVTAPVAWDSPGLSTGSRQDSPSLAAIMQEALDSNDDPTEMAIVAHDDGGANGDAIGGRAWDQTGDDTEAPWLDYTVSGAAGGGIRNPFGGPMTLRNPLGA